MFWQMSSGPLPLLLQHCLDAFGVARVGLYHLSTGDHVE